MDQIWPTGHSLLTWSIGIWKVRGLEGILVSGRRAKEGLIREGKGHACSLFPVGPAVESGHVRLLSELPRLGHAHKVVK